MIFTFAPNRSLFTTPKLMPTACAVGLAFALSACGAANDDDSTRNEAGEVVEGGEVGTFRLTVGDCIAEEAEGELESVPVVPCSEPHVSELFHSYDLEGDEYPGEEAVIATAEAVCIDEFDSFIGTPYQESDWDVSFLYPTENSWDGLDDREILCAVVTVSGELTTGTAEGVAT